MRVLLVHDKDVARASDRADPSGVCSSDAGGVAVYLAQLMRGLEREGVGVSAVDFRPSCEGEVLDPQALPLGASGLRRSYRLPGFRLRYRATVHRALNAVLEREDPDVVHVHGLSTLHPRLFRDLCRRPLIWTLHDTSLVCLRRTLLDRRGQACERAVGFGCLSRGCHRPGEVDGRTSDWLRIASLPLYLRMYRNAPAVTVPSQYVKQVLVRNGFRAEHLRVLPLCSRFAGASSPSFPQRSEPSILFAGRLSREKGVLQLLEALARIRAFSWIARFAGDGPERSELEKRLGALGLSERVHLTGELAPDALSAALTASDLVVVPSLAPESFGLIGVEAMAHGRPVVAYDGGGAEEWLDDGITGALVPHGDVEWLARTISSLLQDADRRVRWGVAARARQQERFTLDAHLSQLLEQYDEVILADGSLRA